jgi:putative flippase GtrA
MIHFVKYNIIGLANTAITLVLVWFLHQLLNMPVVAANFLGYVAGGLNSYFWNKFWNFKSKNSHSQDAWRFLIVFAASYFINLGVLLGTQHLLFHYAPLMEFSAKFQAYAKPGYLAHVVANIVYVFVSFFLYKKVVFIRHSK